MTERINRAVALGIFDGVHLGHRSVIARAVGMEKQGLLPSVFTFKSSTLPAKQGRAVEYIYTDEYRERLLKGLGICDVINADFSQIHTLSGESFVKDILFSQLGTRYVVCGRDFRFGSNASCGADELCRLCGELGINAEIAEDVMNDGENISSRRIRELLKAGNVTKANELLGENYILSAAVTDGNHLGRTINFPTINQPLPEGRLVMRYGVYRTVTHVSGRKYSSVTNVGVKPTVVGERAPLAETHLIGFSGDLYGQTAEVEFLSFVRPERRFDSLDALKIQIEADIKKCI